MVLLTRNILSIMYETSYRICCRVVALQTRQGHVPPFSPDRSWQLSSNSELSLGLDQALFLLEVLLWFWQLQVQIQVEPRFSVSFYSHDVHVCLHLGHVIGTCDVISHELEGTRGTRLKLPRSISN